MKLLCRRTDGTLLGRVADSQLTFPVPADVCIIESMEDIPSSMLSNGADLGQIINAKNAAFMGSHPTFTYPFQANIEFISANCDLANSDKVISGPGKSTNMVAGYGATWVSNTILCSSMNVYICARLNFFLLGRKSQASNQRFYNYDEISGDFVADPTTGFDVSARLVDAADPNTVITGFTSDEEVETPVYLTDFKVRVDVFPVLEEYVHSNVRLYLSDFSLLTRQAPLS